MKSLKDYIYESVDSAKDVIKAEPIKPTDITFNFADLTDGKETKKEIINLAVEDGIKYEDEDDKLTLTVNANDAEKLEKITILLKDYCKSLRNSSKRTNDESYAQKTKSFESSYKKLMKVISNIEDTEEDNSNNEDE